LPEPVWEGLLEIKTQYWTMVKTGGDAPWIYLGKPRPFQYGDLVILVTSHPVEGFQWQPAGDPQLPVEVPQTGYYSYEEQSDYLPLFVETDSASSTQEIAVVVDGQVRGAAVRAPGDTLTEVNAYLEGVGPGLVIGFDTWDGTKSQSMGKNSYVVIDHGRKVREQRTLYTGERARYYHVSLQTGEALLLPPPLGPVSCHPNPFSEAVEFSLRLNRESDLRLEVTDLAGDLVKTLVAGRYPEGQYRFMWQGDRDTGEPVSPGVYVYRASAGGEVIQTDKLIMIR
jgi:hypothetical protein